MISSRLLQIAAELARRSPMPLDQLPYTPEFAQIHKEFVRISGSPHTEQECWQTLIGARKRGMVGSLRRHSSAPRTNSRKSRSPREEHRT